MKKLLAILLLVGFNFIPQLSKANFTFIDSLKIAPLHPKEGDSITLYAYIVITWGTPVNIKYHSYLEKNSSSVDVYSCYLLSSNPEAYYIIDTVSLGTFSTGNYNIRYILKEPFSWEVDSPENCMTYQYYDSAFTTFEVERISSILEQNDLNLSISFNASAQKIVCDFIKAEIPQIEIFSPDGKLLATKSGSFTQKFDVDVSNLSSGIYFARVTVERKQVVKKFFKY